MNRSIDRRDWLALQLAAAASMASLSRPARGLEGAVARSPMPPIDIGSRLELLVDDYLIASNTGASFQLHRPVPQEAVITCDAPWEGNTSAYFSIFQDEQLYRMYYRGAHFDEKTKKASHPEVVCYAESEDGLNWRKPSLERYEFAGSKKNNIIRVEDGTHNFTPFLDANPACPPQARYKALASGTTNVDGKKKACLHAYESADGIRWKQMAEAVITDGVFDSQNLAFWDAMQQRYRAYWRFFTNKTRAIRTATSTDFLHWENQADLRYVDSPNEHLYTNAIRPYFRAPHLYIGFPTRFQPATQQVEPVFMSSRDGVEFRRANEPLIPITAPQDRDGNRSNYMTYGLLQLPGKPNELSVYASEAYYEGPGSRLRRFTFRLDGFMSLHAAGPAIVKTHPLRFEGSELLINIDSRGRTRVAIVHGDGSPIPGYGWEDCQAIVGDRPNHRVTWKNDPALKSLEHQPIQLQFELDNADLYSFRFRS